MTVIKVDLRATRQWSTGSEAPESGTDPMLPVSESPSVTRKITPEQYRTLIDPEGYSGSTSVQSDTIRFKDLRNDWTALNNSGVVDTVQIFPEVEFEYTFWWYQVEDPFLGGSFNKGGAIFYLMLDPLK